MHNIPTSSPTLKNVLDQLPCICFWKDKNSVYKGGNKALLESNGFLTLDEIVGRCDYDLPQFYDDADKYTEQDKFSLAGNTQFNVARPHNPDGTKAVHLIKKGPLFNDNNEITGLIGVGFEMTRLNFKDIFSMLATADLKISDFITNNSNKDPIFSYKNIHFTKREAQVIGNLLRGNTAASTAKNLCLSRKTVEHYIEKLKDKLDCQNKVELINKAFDLGFIDLMFIECQK